MKYIPTSVILLIAIIVGYGFFAKKNSWWPHNAKQDTSGSMNQNKILTLEDIVSNGSYIKGVPATNADVTSDKAVFSTNGKSTALNDVLIPQYAYHNEQNGSKTLCIVIQAEHGDNNLDILGAVIAESGEKLAGLKNEFDFIGTKLPSAN